ncbi:hypothetical protein GSH41_004629 [Salmonella enterica]|uniref:Uncharacterized protein n=1 Tax=Salmonella infantis TaxID=595 RepID=A0A740K479_SALIN|nr:hypothetical protein [Salmonella enterica subsp. enterica]EDN6533825.1 hypothetical protein [Salmonella enterica subsp. enterica serovar Infantis]EDN6700027.1 hypothetical protein [Salmonella enterica]EDQ4838340.1 hypothetical protein [Salmonella enterica subsp. enterica serovar Senegal]EDQ5706173.1 hypothetical protein [Salmonella enterica subsp. enterica serovar -:r:1,5]EDR9533913.1 hypothetical protein [Salmonella enterica subsp. enterica serovar O rough]EDS1233396.1 hypothetical protei
MCGICIAVAYVDARHMFSISLFLSFLSEIRKKVKSEKVISACEISVLDARLFP